MYKIEKGRPYYFPLLILRYAYVVPRSFEKSYLKIFWIKYIVMTLFRLLAVCAWPMSHLIMTLKDNTGVDITENLSVAIGGFGCILMSFLFTLQYKKWSEFFTEVAVFKKSGSRTNIEKAVKNISRISIIYINYVIIGIAFYGAAALSESSHCKQLNQEKGLHEPCFVFYTVWLPFDATDILSSVIIFTIQTVAVIQILSSGSMLYFLVLESSEVLILHINILKEDFINLFENASSNEEIYARLRFCINYHNYILRLGKRFSILQKYTIGHNSFIAAVVFGCILNQISQNAKPIGAVMYLAGYITGVALCCYAGQRITDQTSSISDAVFESNWVKADPQTKKDLALIILRSQTPIYLNCLLFGTHDYALFVAILKTSYSYLTLLNGST